MNFDITAVNALLKEKVAPQVANQISDNISPFYDEIKNNTIAGGGKGYFEPIQLGINGGVAFSGEVNTPEAQVNPLDRFKVDTKNLFGVMGITEKLLRQGNAESIVNHFGWESQKLVESIKFNKKRAIEGGSDGTCALADGAVDDDYDVVVDNTNRLEVGMFVTFYDAATKAKITTHEIKKIDEDTLTITLATKVSCGDGDIITNVDSYGLELTGLNDIFKNNNTIYGIDRTDISALHPYIKANFGAVSDEGINLAIQRIEGRRNVKINFILMAYDVQNFYMAYTKGVGQFVQSLELKGGFKTISFNGIIPMVSSRFAPNGQMDLLDTKTFKFVELGTPSFMNTGNGILDKIQNAAAYQATFCDFTELYCNKPGGQGRLTGVTASV
jgi:hypothetical protein